MTTTSTVSLATTYLGLPLRNPLVASSSPATRSVERLMALADAGSLRPRLVKAERSQLELFA